MPRITMLPEGEGNTEQENAIREEIRQRGRMTNLKRIQAHSPAALRIYGEWFTLKSALAGVLSDRAIFILCLAISEAQQAAIPIGFFRRALAGLGAHPDHFEPDDAERALQAFGRAVGRDAGRVPDDVWLAVAAHFDEAAKVNLAAFAGIMVATTVFANIVQAVPDADVRPFLAPEAEA